ncbi:MAG: SMC-Scp complex subunit ScpB [Pseudomonadota bacterium]
MEEAGASSSEAALDLAGQRRMVEAVLFAAQRPLTLDEIISRLPGEPDAARLLVDLQDEFSTRGFCLVERGGRWQFQTASDLSFLLQEEMDQTRRLSRAAVETLAIIAYHQPVTRSEIEDLRGVSLSRGTLDVLLEAEWIRPRGRKQVPGRPVLYATSEHFLAHFGLEALDDLPGLAELRAAGLLDPVDDVLARMLDATTSQPSDEAESAAAEENEDPTSQP